MVEIIDSKDRNSALKYFFPPRESLTDNSSVITGSRKNYPDEDCSVCTSTGAVETRGGRGGKGTSVDVLFTSVMWTS